MFTQMENYLKYTKKKSILFTYWLILEHKNAQECELNGVYDDFGWKLVSTHLIFSQNGKILPA